MRLLEFRKTPLQGDGRNFWSNGIFTFGRAHVADWRERFGQITKLELLKGCSGTLQNAIHCNEKVPAATLKPALFTHIIKEKMANLAEHVCIVAKTAKMTK